MIISCPECDGKFRIDASALGPGGRTVRCGKCAHTWLQTRPEPEAEVVPAAVPGEAADAAQAAAKTNPVEADVNDAADDAIDWDAPAEIDGDDVPARPRRRSRPDAVDGPTSRWPAVAAWAGLVLVIGGLGAGLYGFRDDIMNAWPETAGLYDRLDLAQPGFGLVLAVPRARQTKIDGATALVIEGRIENPTSRARAVPKMLRLQLFDKDQRELQTETFDSPVQRLMPRQSATYKIELKDPAKKRDILLISFAVGRT